MSFLERFFGRGNTPKNGLTAVSTSPDQLSLQLVLANGLPQASNCQRALRSYHRTMGQARYEADQALQRTGSLIALAGWGEHVIRLVGFDIPMPSAAVEQCVAPAHYPQELKARVRRHKSHLLLYYAGSETDISKQYVALASVAGALSSEGVIAVLNETARTSFPAAALAPDSKNGDILELLSTLPLLVLYCGFVKLEVENQDGVWMRTYGAERFGASNLAARAVGHHQGEYFFNLFENVLSYQIASKARLAAGHTMQVGDDVFIRFSSPHPDLFFLESPSDTLVVEAISPAEIASKRP